MAVDTTKYKALLETELGTLEEELKTVGFQSADNPADWKPKPSDKESDLPDKNDAADAIESFETNAAILKELEIRLQNVKRALKKIEDSTYGVCEVSGAEIEEARLDANPAARTNIENRDVKLPV